MIVEYEIEVSRTSDKWYSWLVKLDGDTIAKCVGFEFAWLARRHAKKWIRAQSVQAKQYPVKKTIYRVEVKDD